MLEGRQDRLSGCGTVSISGRKIGEDRAIGAIVAVAGMGEVLQCAGHVFHLGDLLAQPCDLCECQALDVAARPGTVMPKGKKVADAVYGEAKTRDRRTKRSIWTSFSV